MANYRKIYEQHYGPIPKGYHVHHKDMNHGNDDPLNLEALEPDIHAQKHGFLNNFIMAHATAMERVVAYNSSKTGIKRGKYKRNDLEVGKKISAALVGRTLSLEHRAAIAATRLRGVPRTQEIRAAISAGLKGTKRSPEVRAARSVMQQGKKRGPYKKRAQ